MFHSATSPDSKKLLENIDAVQIYLKDLSGREGSLATKISDLAAKLGMSIFHVYDCVSVLLFRGDVSDIVPSINGEVCIVLKESA